MNRALLAASSLAASVMLAVGSFAAPTPADAPAVPSLSSLISRTAPAAERGSTFGVSQSAGSLARILAPMWAGWSFGHLSWSTPLATGAAVMLLAGASTAAAAHTSKPNPIAGVRGGHRG